MTPVEARQTVLATIARLGMAETALEAGIGTTIARSPASERAAADPLPPLAFTTDAGAHGNTVDLESRALLGRGGMGVVHLAEQRSLRREVAVKIALGDETTRAALVREARTMGGLEHPNVVPVHALGRGESGEPILVMKRVEGATWRALLDEPGHANWAPLLSGHGDRTRANVEILAQVSRALAFAHSRGVVHRDLKPDNVRG